MTLVYVSIPIMVLFVALASAPGLIATYWDRREARKPRRTIQLPGAGEEETRAAA